MHTTAHTKRTSRGQSLIEVLIALTIAVISISTLAYLIFSAHVSARFSIEHIRAQLLAQEGVEASRTIGQRSFADLVPGTHGLALTYDQWMLAGSQDQHGKYTRTIAISDISAGIKQITSNVVWELRATQYASTTYTTYVSNWAQTAGAAAFLSLDPSSATYNASSTVVDNLYVHNNHISDTTQLTPITITWDGESTLNTLDIDSTRVYTAATGTPVTSGTSIDIQDYTLSAGGLPVHIGPIAFSSDMEDGDLHIQHHLDDGSTYHARVSF